MLPPLLLVALTQCQDQGQAAWIGLFLDNVYAQLFVKSASDVAFPVTRYRTFIYSYAYKIVSFGKGCDRS